LEFGTTVPILEFETSIMGFFSKKTGKDDTTKKTGIQWHQLTTEAELEAIIERSNTVPCAIFKHSTRCSISSMALSRFERQWDLDSTEIEPYYLDLIAYRSVSDKIAEVLFIQHQSPQIILLKDGKAIYDTSHNDITVEGLKAILKA